MTEITETKAKILFNKGGEIWVYTGDYVTSPSFEYATNSDGVPIVEDNHRLMHPKSLDCGDSIEDLIYNSYYIA